MTPEQHLDHAEQLLKRANTSNFPVGSQVVMELIMSAVCHALIAHVAEAGVPHPVPESEGGGPGAYPLDPRL